MHSNAIGVVTQATQSGLVLRRTSMASSCEHVLD